GLDLGSREKHREVPAGGPATKQVAVVGALRVAGLPGNIGAEGAVPVSRVGDDPERRTGRLVVLVGGAVDGVTVASTREALQVEASPEVAAHCVAQGMPEPDVLEFLLSVAPTVHVGTKAVLKAGHGLLECGEQNGVPAGERIGPEAAVGHHQPTDD